MRVFKDEHLRACKEPLADVESGLDCLGQVCSDEESAAFVAMYLAAVERKRDEREAQNKKAASI